MEYKKVRTVDDKGVYHDQYILTIFYTELPAEFIEDLRAEKIEEPEVQFGSEGLTLFEESYHG